MDHRDGGTGRGSGQERPIDSKIEVLSADGRPVERLLLRPTRDSELEFRPCDSQQRGMRLASWEEIELNDLIYMEGEVIKQYQQRRGPDADSLCYPEGAAATPISTPAARRMP